MDVGATVVVCSNATKLEVSTKLDVACSSIELDAGRILEVSVTCAATDVGAKVVVCSNATKLEVSTMLDVGCTSIELDAGTIVEVSVT